MQIPGVKRELPFWNSLSLKKNVIKISDVIWFRSTRIDDRSIVGKRDGISSLEPLNQYSKAGCIKETK